jgi:uncharacterized protein
VPSSNRRSFIVQGTLAAIALPGVVARRTAACVSPGDPRDATGNGDGRYSGNYLVDAGHAIGIDQFILEESGETTLLISDYQSGIVRRLFPVSAELTVRFLHHDTGIVTAISMQPVGGAARVAERIALKQQEVSFSGHDARLAGTLFVPAGIGPHPAVVLLHGSGPLSRFSFGPYPHFFTSLGMAVLIYDKRGTGASTGTRMEIASDSSLQQMSAAHYPDELTDDALAALHFVQGRQEIAPGKIGLWGSSEGGMLSTQVAARSRDVAFIINSSGFMGPLWQTLLYQVEAELKVRGASAADTSQALAFTKLWLRVAQTGNDYALYLRQSQRVRDEGKHWFFWWQNGFASLEQMRWVWSHRLRFDPRPALTKVRCPVLGVFGELDRSTDAVTAASNMQHVLAEAGHKDFTVRIFPNASHSLGEMPSGNRMVPGVFDTLRTWLLARV